MLCVCVCVCVYTCACASACVCATRGSAGGGGPPAPVTRHRPATEAASAAVVSSTHSASLHNRSLALHIVFESSPAGSGPQSFALALAHSVGRSADGERIDTENAQNVSGVRPVRHTRGARTPGTAPRLPCTGDIQQLTRNRSKADRGDRYGRGLFIIAYERWWRSVRRRHVLYFRRQQSIAGRRGTGASASPPAPGCRNAAKPPAPAPPARPRHRDIRNVIRCRAPSCLGLHRNPWPTLSLTISNVATCAEIVSINRSAILAKEIKQIMIDSCSMRISYKSGESSGMNLNISSSKKHKISSLRDEPLSPTPSPVTKSGILKTPLTGSRSIVLIAIDHGPAFDTASDPADNVVMRLWPGSENLSSIGSRTVETITLFFDIDSGLYRNGRRYLVVRSRIFHTLFLRVQVRDGGLMLPHSRTSSHRGHDPDSPVVMAPFRGSKLEEFPSQSKIKRSCQWVHRHHPRPSRSSLGGMVK
ncbi:hypothetical protein EVAR_4275_1 [Eumeta japonica]|uniref:Uncharacterized protein n=1 Tax=Eumeta variegata TaxID=151549 RepID=A0A4C1VB92_EUMVA|nr:hypothetical protein EVAR_4275_1 [Eumeta japonica]